MQRDKHLQKLAEISGMPDSEALYKILECAMTSEEARFIVELPALRPDHFPTFFHQADLRRKSV